MVLIKPSLTRRVLGEDSVIPQCFCCALCCSQAQCSQSESYLCWGRYRSRGASWIWCCVFKWIHQAQNTFISGFGRESFNWCCWVFSTNYAVRLSPYLLMTGSKSKFLAGLRVANKNFSLSAEIFAAFAASAALVTPKAVARVGQGLTHVQRWQRIPGSATKLFQFPFLRCAQRMLVPCSLSRYSLTSSDNSSFSTALITLSHKGCVRV